MDEHKPRWRPAWPFGWRTSLGLLAGALLAAVLAGPALRHFAGSDPTASALANPFRNPLDYFSQRSPGGRSPGALVQTKHRVQRAARHAARPHERVLANIRGGPGGLTDRVPGYLDELVPNFKPGLLDPKPPHFDSPPGPSYPIVPVPIAPRPPSVPEPDTWMMQILGFVLIGHCLRHCRPEPIPPDAAK